MKKLLYTMILLICISSMYSQEIKTSKKFKDLQPGLFQMYQPYNDSLGDYLGFILSCYPYAFNNELWDFSTQNDTLKYNWNQDTICVKNSYHQIGGCDCILFSSTDAIEIEMDKLNRNKYPHDQLYKIISAWNIEELDSIFVPADSDNLEHIFDWSISYYSRAIIQNGKIIKYNTLPKVISKRWISRN